MLEFLTAEANAPFSIALLLMLMIALFEGVAVVLGFGFSSMIDALLPEIDLAPDALEVPSGGLTGVLGWLMVGRVPVLMILVVFLTLFGLIGLTAQYSLLKLIGHLAPGGLLAIPVALLTLPVLRTCNQALARRFVDERSQVVSLDELVGKVGVITVGVAEPGSPAQARVKDRFGTQHYVMVEPDGATAPLHQGESVLLVEYRGTHFTGITPQSDHLQSME
ncbi:YqiJ family protein [Ferrimonas balearica]|uniref:YqiJ family protein n=1 Tax=Ferrimonas balearica TaxID=44012 RepID=UPI001C997AA8|nr:YqiJ family protein [Ferrimonas balearica]MBY5992863.1 YqiJ family protein [Ferrimonas balearica]